MLRNTAAQTVSAGLISKTTGDDVTTGVTVVYVTIDGGTQALGTGVVQHEGNGEWTYFPLQSETDGNHLSYKFINAAAISVNIQIYTEPELGTYPTITASAGVSVTSYNDILTLALGEINAIDPGDTPSSSDIETARQYFNLMVDQWATRRLYCYVISHASYPWVTSKQAYTIGPTGDFVASRPVKIEHANLIISGTTDIHVPLSVITMDDYSNISIPVSSAGMPSALYYRPTNPNGTLYPYPYPTTVADELELFTWTPISEVASVDLGNYVSFPPGYRMAIVKNLAKLLCGPYEKSVSADLDAASRTSLADISSLNSYLPVQGSDVPCSLNGNGMRWNPSINGWSL
jgi:hypothetical protein